MYRSIDYIKIHPISLWKFSSVESWSEYVCSDFLCHIIYCFPFTKNSLGVHKHPLKEVDLYHQINHPNTTATRWGVCFPHRFKLTILILIIICLGILETSSKQLNKIYEFKHNRLTRKIYCAKTRFTVGLKIN